MGTPIAPVYSEVFLEEIDKNIFRIPEAKFYCRYVDDCNVFIKKNEILSAIQKVNRIHKNLRFTYESEIDGHIHYLDANIERKNGLFQTSVYRKETRPLTVYITVYI